MTEGLSAVSVRRSDGIIRKLFRFANVVQKGPDEKEFTIDDLTVLTSDKLGKFHHCDGMFEESAKICVMDAQTCKDARESFHEFMVVQKSVDHETKIARRHRVEHFSKTRV